MFKKIPSSRMPPSLRGYNFTPAQAEHARLASRLLTMRVETSPACNLRCIYCNSHNGARRMRGLPIKTLERAVAEAHSLGAKSVVVIGGGEPTLYPHFRRLIRDIHILKMTPVVITNGLQLTPGLCKFLFASNASLLVKFDSLRAQAQDRLSGKKGTHRLILRGLNNLHAAGFFGAKRQALRVGLSFVVTKLNYDEIPSLWKFCRESGLYPNLEELIPRGRGKHNLDELWVSKEALHRLKTELLRIDRRDYGFDWPVHTPLSGHGCLQFFYSIYLANDGYLRPCADIDVKFCNFEHMSLQEALRSPFFTYVRDIRRHLQGKCASCEFGSTCVGCRGLAFSAGRAQGMGEFAAVACEDPVCGKLAVSVGGR